jgi:ABC-2 type transport system permease protein
MMKEPAMTDLAPNIEDSVPPAWTMLSIETRLFLREPIGLVWGLVLPLVAFVVLGCIPALSRPKDYLGGATFLEVYQPVLILASLAMLALNGLPPVLGSYRERGVLRRLRTTPMPPARLLGAQLVIHLVVASATAVLLLGVGVAAFDVALPADLAGWALAYVLSCVAMLSLGVLIAAASPSGKLANAVGGLLFFPIAFFAGLWLPRQSMPHLLGEVSDYTPLGAAVRSMTAATHGGAPPAAALVVLGTYAVLFVFAAIRWFRWE